MEIVINNKFFEIKEGKIYGLIMSDQLNKANNILLNTSYYENNTLINDKMGQVFGVTKKESFTNNKRVALSNFFSTKSNYYIIENIEKNFTYNDLNVFNKFFRNLSLKYNKSIILKSNDLDYLLNIVDYLIDYKTELIYNKEDFYEMQIFDFIDKPVLLEIANKIISKNINIKIYANRLDLLKGIFKLVK